MLKIKGIKEAVVVAKEKENGDVIKLIKAYITIDDEISAEYVKAELKDIFAMADVVISRAGANAICELLALKKPNVLIPLMAGSRGDQILNAKSFESQGYSKVLMEDDITNQLLVDTVHELYFNKRTYIESMSNSHQQNAIKTILSLIEETVAKEK